MSRGIGEVLRQRRVERAIALDEAAAATCIRPGLLRALEEERFAAIGSPFYVRAFLRAYARFLDLDPEPLLARYRRTEPEEQHPLAMPGSALAPGDRPPLTRLERAVGVTAVFCLLLAMLLVVGRSVEPSGPEPAAASLPLVDIERADTPAEAEPTPEPSPVVEQPAPSGVQVELRIAGGPSWLRVTVDGEVVIEGIQPDGTVLALDGQQEITVRVGNAAVVHLSSAEGDTGPLGGPGEVVDRTFTAPPTA